MILLSFISSIFQIPPVAFFAQVLNILITVVFWLGYKIARAKLSIDLRLWVIVEGVTFAYFILVQTVVLLPSTFSLDIEPLIFTGLFMLLIFLTDVVRERIINFVVRRWDLIKSNSDGESHNLDNCALYLIKSGPLDVIAYSGVGVSFALIILSSYQNPANPSVYIIPIVVLTIVLMYMLFWRIRRSQKSLIESYQTDRSPA